MPGPDGAHSMYSASITMSDKRGEADASIGGSLRGLTIVRWICCSGWHIAQIWNVARYRGVAGMDMPWLFLARVIPDFLTLQRDGPGAMGSSGNSLRAWETMEVTRLQPMVHPEPWQ
jgi:hypothetical protein